MRSGSKFAREKLYSVPDLKDRGWTDSAIKKYLPPEPDDTRPNPRYSNAGAPMKFWLKSRVHRAEKTKAFVTWREGVDARQAAAAQAVVTRSKNMAEEMRTAKIIIKRGLSTKEIHGLARRTHGGNYEGDPGEFIWCNKTARDCIRHNLTNYEALWSICNRGDTGREAYDVLRERVDALIDEAYPQFSGYDYDLPEDAPKKGEVTYGLH